MSCYVSWYHLLALWRDSCCLGGSGMWSLWTYQVKSISIRWLLPVLWVFCRWVRLCMWIRGGYWCCFAFHGLEAVCTSPTVMIGLLVSIHWGATAGNFARFEVSFRVESICCNGPVLLWLYPVYLFVMLTWWWILSRCGSWPGCWRCLSTCPAEYFMLAFRWECIFDLKSTLVSWCVVMICCGHILIVF